MRNSHPLCMRVFIRNQTLRKSPRAKMLTARLRLAHSTDCPHRLAHPPRQPVNGLGPDPSKESPVSLLRRAQKDVEKPKIQLDNASHKLYYVN